MKRTSYFHRMERQGDDAHPIDLAVRRRVPQTAAQKRLVQLQARVRELLGNDADTFGELEMLLIDIRMEREQAYFDLGYEHGLAAGAVRQRRAARDSEARQLARDVRERVVQAQLPLGRAALGLLECLREVLLSEEDHCP
jgi:hypothetical protein